MPKVTYTDQAGETRTVRATVGDSAPSQTRIEQP
jgi:hypothetical protein